MGIIINNDDVMTTGVFIIILMIQLGISSTVLNKERRNSSNDEGKNQNQVQRKGKD
jgi:hypothetical protein